MEEDKKKNIGKKVLTIVITVIITLIVLFCIFLSWLLIANPLNVRGIILYKLGWTDEPVKIINVEEKGATFDTKITPPTTSPPKLPADFVPSSASIPMTPAQREAVENFGIDPDSLIVTPQMVECFVEKLGTERVGEIIGGVTPGALDLLKANSCL